VAALFGVEIEREHYRITLDFVADLEGEMPF
jgi:hypothetical protein